METKPKRAGVWQNLGVSLVDLNTESTRDDGPPRGQKSSWRWRLTRFGRRGPRIVRSSALSIVLLTLVIADLAIQAFSSLELPPAIRSPKVLVLLAIIGLFFAVRTYFEALRSLAFYQRFINPGLRRLLEIKGENLYRGEKLFRGRKTVLMKIDIVGFTQTTFEMPYGVRRLFLDLWYTLIDQVVAGNVFLDKTLGDGSVYCFDDPTPGGACQKALQAAVEIRDHQVGRFDEVFRNRLRESLEESAELERVASAFIARYEEQAGSSFWARETTVRIALVSGYVDEGLWGLSSQSHYDVQGSLPILVARLEETAHDGEIVCDRSFLDDLEAERPGLVDRASLERRTVELKGIGPWEVFVVGAGVNPSH